MKILFVSSDFNIGGAAQSLIEMAEGLRVYVHPIIIIPDKGNMERQLVDRNIDYYIVPLSRGFGVIGSHTVEDETGDFKINYEAALQIKSIVEKEKIDLIHINSSVSNAGALGAILSDVPYIWHLREILEKHFSCEFWDKELKQLLFRRASECIAISNCVSKDYKEMYGLKTEVIYDAVEAKRYYRCISEKTKENHSFILAGNISESKGQLDAIKAVRKLKELGIEDIKLILVGNHSDRFSWCLKKYIDYDLKENITLYSFVYDLAELRKKASFALVTSKFEALGRVTIEAMLSGCIVVGADVGGTVEIIGEDEERGLLYKQGNIDSLAETMMRAIGLSKVQKRKIREKAQEFAMERFDTEHYAKSLLKLYDKVLNEYKCNASNEEIKRELLYRYENCRDSDFTRFVARAGVSKRQRIDELWTLWDETNRKCKEKNIWKDRLIEKVIIYGMGRLGMRLYDECKDENIEIAGVLDRDKYFLSDILSMIAPGKEMPPADLVIVTAISDYEEIKKELEEKTDAEIIHIKDWIMR